MVWRRLLVPMSYTLHELHGVLQAAMGWEGLHLFELKVRGVGYGSFVAARQRTWPVRDTGGGRWAPP